MKMNQLQKLYNEKYLELKEISNKIENLYRETFVGCKFCSKKMKIKKLIFTEYLEYNYIKGDWEKHEHKHYFKCLKCGQVNSNLSERILSLQRYFLKTEINENENA